MKMHQHHCQRFTISAFELWAGGGALAWLRCWHNVRTVGIVGCGDYRVKLFQNELCTQGKTIVELLKYVCRWDLFYNAIFIIILLNPERVTHGSFSIRISLQCLDLEVQ